MNRDHDPLADAFADLRRATLDPAVSSRVQKIARAELAPVARTAAPSARLVAALAASIVPALLLSAAAARVVETVQLAAAIYR